LLLWGLPSRRDVPPERLYKVRASLEKKGVANPDLVLSTSQKCVSVREVLARLTPSLALA
jgi:sugar-specific transcriptional regulator TrmB